MAHLPKNLPALLRQAGLTVVEIYGWYGHGRPGPFGPVGPLNHHIGASARGWSLNKEKAYARWMFRQGRRDLPAPLCQIALGRSGVVYIGASGRANHAGTAKASGSVAAGDGNSLYIGIEWMLSGTEPIPAEMMEAGITLNAVLTEKVTKTSVRTISCHYQTSVTGKWDIGDPNGIRYKDKMVLDVDKFRRLVEEEREILYRPKPVSQPRRAVRIISANLDYTRDGDRKYINHLKRSYRPAVACLQEVERGLKGTRVRGWGVKVYNKRRWVLGKNGAHRATAVAGVDLPGSKKRLRVISGHAPHPGTVGAVVHALWLTLLAAKTRALDLRGIPWVMGVDSNTRHKAAARMLNGAAYGQGVDAVIASKRLKVTPVAVDNFGKRNGYTNHVAIVADISV